MDSYKLPLACTMTMSIAFIQMSTGLAFNFANANGGADDVGISVIADSNNCDFIITTSRATENDSVSIISYSKVNLISI